MTDLAQTCRQGEMTPEEFMAIVRALPAEDYIAYRNDLALYGRGFIKKIDGQYRRVAPHEAIVLR